MSFRRLCDTYAIVVLVSARLVASRDFSAPLQVLVAFEQKLALMCFVRRGLPLLIN